MSVIVVDDGQLIVKDPNDIRIFLFDWDLKNLPAGVKITTNTFTLTVLSGANGTPLVKDNEAKLTAAQATTALGRTVALDDRVTRLRLDDGTLGTLYKVENEIVTDETPSQTKNRMFLLKIEDL